MDRLIMTAAVCLAPVVTAQRNCNQAMPAATATDKAMSKSKKPTMNKPMKKPAAVMKKPTTMAKSKSKKPNAAPEYRVLQCQSCRDFMNACDAVITYRSGIEEIYCLECFGGRLDSPSKPEEVSSSSESTTLC